MQADAVRDRPSSIASGDQPELRSHRAGVHRRTGALRPQQIYNLRYAFEDAAQHGVTVLAASGDNGATDTELNLVDIYPFRSIDWPSSDPLVTGVGGTRSAEQRG